MNYKSTTTVLKLRKLDSRTRIVRGGTSAGKTIAILLILISYACNNDNKEISVVSESIPHLRRGALKDFIAILKALNRYREKKFNRSTLKYQFINECNNVPFDAYQQLAIRTSGNIWLDYNPTSLFWVDKELIGQPDTDFITVTYKDNDSLPESIVKEIEKAKDKAKTSAYWKNWWRVYGLGEVGQLEGACIPDWKEIKEVPNEAKLVGAGLDFGYTVDSTSIVNLYKYNDTYIFDEVLYRTGMLNRDISNFIKNNNINCNIYADSAEPKSIAEIRLSGIDVFPVAKGRDSIVYGINLINQNKVFVTHKSKNLKKELEGYVWMKDKQGNTLQKPNPLTGDHAIDAARYVMMMVLENPNRGKYYLY